MSSSVRVNESPNHFMVLDAIARGVRNPDKIAKVTKLDRAEVELILNDLVTQRLITMSEKKRFFGGTKFEATITETGSKLLVTKKQDLEKKMQQIQQYYNNGNTAMLQQTMDSNRMWFPLMLFSGIMNMMFFMSMMSLVGMAMSPAESAQAGDAGAGEGGAATDGAESGGDAGGFEGGDFGGGDFSF